MQTGLPSSVINFLDIWVIVKSAWTHINGTRLNKSSNMFSWGLFNNMSNFIAWITFATRIKSCTRSGLGLNHCSTRYFGRINKRSLFDDVSRSTNATQYVVCPSEFVTPIRHLTPPLPPMCKFKKFDQIINNFHEINIDPSITPPLQKLISKILPPENPFGFLTLLSSSSIKACPNSLFDISCSTYRCKRP